MKIITGITLVIIIALLGARKTFTRIRLPGARELYLTGTEYIIVGLCLGDQLLGILDETSIRGLEPLLYLALGWIGLLFGIQLEIPQIKKFPIQYFVFAMVQALATMLACAVPLLAMAALHGGWQGDTVFVGALALAAMAIPTAQSSLALLQQELDLRRSKAMEMLGYVAGIDAILGLAVLGVLFSYNHNVPVWGSRAVDTIVYLASSASFGAAMGILLHILTRVRCSEEELLLFTIGVVVLASGVAAYVGISPLFVTAVSGFVIGNLRGARARILRALAILEKPFYIIILLFGGAMLNPGQGWQEVILITVAYVLCRTTGKVLGGGISGALIKKPVAIHKWIGLGLTSQGGMAVAMVVSFHAGFSGPLADLILLVVLLATIINELVSPFLARALLRRVA